MARKKTVRKKSYKADVARQFLRKYPDSSCAEFMKSSGVRMSSSQYSTIRTQLRKTATTTEKLVRKPRNQNVQEIQKLRRYVKYLQWVRIGEREGFVDELLREVAE